MIRGGLQAFLSAVVMHFVATLAAAQGLLIFVHPEPVPLPRPIIIYPHPRPLPPPSPPPVSYKIKEISLQTRIVDQVAKVQVSQSFVNTGSRQAEVQFVFPLPYEATIDQLTFMVDGKEIAGKIKPAAEARSIYEGYVRRNLDPALLEWLGTGMFQTSVFPIPPGAERKVTLSYSTLLRKDHTLTDFLFPLSTAKYTSHPVEKLSIQVSIESQQDIKNVYSPSHLCDVSRPDAKHATVKLEAKDQIPATDFRLFYDVAGGPVGTSVLSYRPEKGDDGYLLLLVSPEIKAAKDERVPKTVVFAVDRSGSMSGKKIEQAKEALKFVLNNLREKDTFNIVAYDHAVEAFRPELQAFNEESRKAALGFVEGIYAGGSTNIDGALKTSLEMFKDTSRPNYLIFLTDGLPTAGETNELKLAALAHDRNKSRVRMINFGVGYDVNARLLDRMARENFGQSEYVRPDENIEAHVSRLYGRINVPVMTDVAVKIDIDGLKPEEGAAINRMYPKQVYDLFEGDQLVLVARYKKSGAAKVTVTGKVGGQEQKLDFPANLVESSGDESLGFVAKIWAMRRIGEIIDEIDLKGKNDELVKELVALSTKYGILTPYTSFLADENAAPGQLADARGNFDRADHAVRRLASEVDGLGGVAQRGEKKSLQEAAQAPAFSGGANAAAPGAAKASGRAGNVYRDLGSDKDISVQSVMTVQNEALYKRGKQWIAANAADVDISKTADMTTVERFSDAYFALVKDNTPSENSILAQQQTGEEIIIRLRGKVYRIKG